MPTLTIAKLDATANDWSPKDVYAVSGFPTIYFKPAGKAPFLYEGAREAPAMAAFLSSKATHKFSSACAAVCARGGARGAHARTVLLSAAPAELLPGAKAKAPMTPKAPKAPKALKAPKAPKAAKPAEEEL